jgi:hypothetical protein
MSDATRSSSEIERDVERTRSELDGTIHELKDRFSAESAVDYGMNYMRGPGGQRFLGAIRENPLAAAIALAGIGWLLYTANRPKSLRRATTVLSRDGENRQGASRPGVMGDGTQEQNLNQPGDPTARVTQQEVEAAFR